MIERGIDCKVRLLMDQQWFGRREVVKIPLKGDSGETGDNKKENV